VGKYFINTVERLFRKIEVWAKGEVGKYLTNTVERLFILFSLVSAHCGSFSSLFSSAISLAGFSSVLSWEWFGSAYFTAIPFSLAHGIGGS
jgi:hypothetical protein